MRDRQQDNIGGVCFARVLSLRGGVVAPKLGVEIDALPKPA